MTTSRPGTAASPPNADTVVDDERREFLRGPGRGDGRARRSEEWYRDLDEALSRDCPLEIPRKSEPGGVWRCGARVGERCVRFPDRTPLERAAGHYVRIHPGYARTPKER